MEPTAATTATAARTIPMAARKARSKPSLSQWPRRRCSAPGPSCVRGHLSVESTPHYLGEPQSTQAHHYLVSWPAELEPLFVSREQGGPAVELSSNTPEFVEALRHDRQALVRDALLWQRWVRYIGLATFVVMALAFGRER